MIPFQSLISAAKDWEKKLDNLSRLWKVYSQKEQALAGWIQQAQTVLNDNEDDSDSLIRKHKGFFNKIDKRLLDDYLRAGQDILMVLDDRDKSELQQDMASMQETWKVGLIILMRCVRFCTSKITVIFFIFPVFLFCLFLYLLNFLNFVSAFQCIIPYLFFRVFNLFETTFGFFL